MLSGRAALLLVRLLIAAALVAPFWVWHGGLIELETLQFVQQYLDDRTLLRKVFDPHANDFGTYQARELSYFLDYLDARVFAGLMRRDVVAFIPASAVVASLLTVAAFAAGVRRLPLPALTAALLLLVYVTNYVHVVTMGMYYRATKPLLAPLLMATVFFLAARLGPRSAAAARGAGRWGPPAAVFALLTLMSLLDRQGFFYALLGTGLLAGNALLARGRRDLPVAGAAAAGASLAYNLVLAPAIVRRVSGYTPRFEYQNVPLDAVAALRPFQQAAELLLEGATVLLGSAPGWLGLGALLALAAFALRRAGWPAWLALAGLAAAHLFMFAVMIVRHPPLYDWADHRFWYYPLPFQAFVVALVAVLLARLTAGWPARRVAVLNLVLAAAVVSNAAHWTSYRNRMLDSRWFPRIHGQTGALKASLDTGIPHPKLQRQYREFFEYCATLNPALRARIEAATPGEEAGGR